MVEKLFFKFNMRIAQNIKHKNYSSGPRKISNIKSFILDFLGGIYQGFIPADFTGLHKTF